MFSNRSSLSSGMEGSRAKSLTKCHLENSTRPSPVWRNNCAPNISSASSRPTKNATALSANSACESKRPVTRRAQGPVTMRLRTEGPESGSASAYPEAFRQAFASQTIPLPSFVSKSLKRINLRRPLRRQITCDERDHRQQHRRSGVGQRIGRRHPEELANNKATEREGCD